MTDPLVVIEDPHGCRATVGMPAVPDHLLRGFTVLCPANGPGDTRTPDEIAAEADADAKSAAAIAAAMTPAPTPTKTTPAKKETRNG